MVDGQLGVLEGCIALAGFANDIIPDWTSDPDFRVFGAVASEIDDLPFGDSRRFGSQGAHAEADERAMACADSVATIIRAACVNVIRRFGEAPKIPERRHRAPGFQFPAAETDLRLANSRPS
jgi:hypothetical protein